MTRTHAHVHESPSNMLVPLVVLAVLSVAGGWWAAPASIRRRKLLRALSRAGLRRGGDGASATPGLVGALLGAPVVAGLARIPHCLVDVRQAHRCARRAWRNRCAEPIACWRASISWTNSTAQSSCGRWSGSPRMFSGTAWTSAASTRRVNGLGRGAARSGDYLRAGSIPAIRAATRPGLSWARCC